MKLILSTKKLQPNQRDLLLGADFSLIEYDAIQIAHLEVKIPASVENAIFTSQNGVRSIFENPDQIQGRTTTIKNCFCVGEKTKALLIEKGQNVLEMASNSEKLAQIIAKKYNKRSFLYFCGSQRREELPTLLKTANMDVIEVETYKTDLKPRTFWQKWDGILFYSPSAVASFISANNPMPGEKHTSVAFCIGETTAVTAKNYFSNVLVANATRIESVIAKAVKTLQ